MLCKIDDGQFAIQETPPLQSEITGKVLRIG